MCLFFDVREFISKVYDVGTVYTYIPRTVGIETLVGDNKSKYRYGCIYTAL